MAPQTRRRSIPEPVAAFIIEECQYDHQLSKDKLAVMMKQDGVVNLSASTVDFMTKLKHVAPVRLTHIQTDNDSEFAKLFEIELEKRGIVHFHTYPRSPKMKAGIERFTGL